MVQLVGDDVSGKRIMSTLAGTSIIYTFNGSFRDECLNTNRFLSMDDAKEKI